MKFDMKLVVVVAVGSLMLLIGTFSIKSPVTKIKEDQEGGALSAEVLAERQAQGRELAAARAKWAKKGFEHYEMSYSSFNNFYTAKSTVIVSNSKIVNKETVEGEMEANDRHVESMFDMIDVFIKSEAFMLEVSYNEQFGYPTSVSSDGSDCINDDEISVSVGEIVAVDIDEVPVPTEELPQPTPYRVRNNRC